jgi:hypothetical protein
MRRGTSNDPIHCRGAEKVEGWSQGPHPIDAWRNHDRASILWRAEYGHFSLVNCARIVLSCRGGQQTIIPPIVYTAIQSGFKGASEGTQIRLWNNYTSM